MTQAPNPANDPGRIIGAEWAEPHYPFDPLTAPPPCMICGAPMTTCVHDPNQETMTIMAGAAKKAAAAPKPAPEETPVAAAAAEDTVETTTQETAAADEVVVAAEHDADPEVVTGEPASGPVPTEVIPTPMGITTSLSAPPPELAPDAPTYDTVLVDETGIQADWYDEVSDALVMFNRTVEQDFRHEGAKRLSRRQMFVRGQVVPKAQIAAVNATAGIV